MCFVSERIGQGPTTIEAFKDIKGHLRGLVPSRQKGIHTTFLGKRDKGQQFVSVLEHA